MTGCLRVVKGLHSRCVFGRRIRVLAQTLAPLLPAGRVLDVGCGDGAIDELIMAHRPDVAIEGVEVMPRPASAIPVAKFDGRTLPFGPESFDAVLLIDVLHHADDPVHLLRECARISAGAVIVKDHVARGPWGRAVLRFMDWVGNRPHGVVLRYQFLDEQGWERTVRDAGLACVHSVPRVALYPFPFSLVFAPSLQRVFVLRRSRPGPASRG